MPAPPSFGDRAAGRPGPLRTVLAVLLVALRLPLLFVVLAWLVLLPHLLLTVRTARVPRPMPGA